MAKLANNENGNFTDRIDLTYADLALIVAGTNPFTGETLSTAGQLVIGKKPAFGAVECCTVARTVALAGAADITFDIGTTGADPDEYIDALDVAAMTAPVANTGDAFNDGTTAGVINVVDGANAAQDIILEVNGTASSLTAGEAVIKLRILDMA